MSHVYYFYIGGSLRVDPDLTGHDDFEPYRRNYPVTAERLNLHLTQTPFALVDVAGEQTVAIVDGQIDVVGTPGHADVSLPYDDYNTDPENFTAAVEHLVDLVKKANPDALVNGTFIGHQQDDRPNLWRVRVVNNEVIFEQPMLVWPNGEQQPLDHYF